MLHNAIAYYERTAAAPFHRYRSWDHCYTYFSRQEADFDTDYAALMLMYFLASWGMFRNSELINVDYRAIIPVTELVRAKKYVELRGITIPDYTPSKIALCFELQKEVEKYLVTLNVRPTATLLTKTLLGTLACVPAIDRFVKLGLRHQNLTAHWSVQSFTGLLAQFSERYADFGVTREHVAMLAGQHIPYPDMKLLDMELWEIGYQEDASDII